MTHDQLATALDQLPDSASLTLTVPELRELLRDAKDGRGDGVSASGQDQEFFDSTEVASRYRISSKTLRRHRKAGLFPGVIQQGRRWLYPLSALRAYEQWLADATARKGRQSPKEDAEGEREDAPDLEVLGDWQAEERTHAD